jgi:tRNA-splicing ligase RtcB (3'-phosphate/5'-hydroxy nucleic acid ligase)
VGAKRSCFKKGTVVKTLIRHSAYEWEVPVHGAMRVPLVIFASEELVRAMEDKVFEQGADVATLPGIVKASFAMPDAHWGYGFPIGGVAAFDPEKGGIVSMGGVGFDISCGVRTLLTGISAEAVRARQAELADALLKHIPAGVGSTGTITLSAGEMDDMLSGGARWAVQQGWGEPADLAHTEEAGRMAGAVPAFVPDKAKERQKREMGTLGSGNHYLEVQQVTAIHDADAAKAYGLRKGDAVVSIHCGSRGLGHQIGTDALRAMVVAAAEDGIHLPSRELAYAPVKSEAGRRYLGAMRAAINCALANRQIITQLTRNVFAEVLPEARLTVLYDVSHNTCKVEEHEVDGEKRSLYVHRKGATRAFGPGHPEIPEALRETGQPVLIGGTMGTASYVLRGTKESMGHAFGSACHGAGRAMSRNVAKKRWRGRDVVEQLASRGILIRSRSLAGVAEEAPGAYKDVGAVVDAADAAGLARKVARLEPMICVKG